MEPQAIKDLLPTVLNLEPQKQELKRRESGDESRLEVALCSPRIKDASVDSIKEALRFVMVKIGLRAQNWPSDAEKVILIQHVQENFAGNTVEEIRLAFEMAIGGKLNLEFKDVSCYENFSCAYFSRIMIAYREWSVEAVKQVLVAAPPELKIYSDAELENLQRGDIEAFYQRLRNGRVPHGIPEYFKDVLLKDGLLKEGKTMVDFFTARLGNGIENIYLKVEDKEYENI